MTKKTQRSQKDERPAKLTAIETFDIKYLMILNEVALELIKEKHPQALKLANAVKAINFTHQAREGIVEASKAKPKRANDGRAIKASLEHEKIYAEYLKKENKRSDWATAIATKFGKSPATIRNIVSKMKKASK